MVVRLDSGLRDAVSKGEAIPEQTLVGRSNQPLGCVYLYVNDFTFVRSGGSWWCFLREVRRKMK